MKMQKNKKLVQAAAVGLSVCVLAGGGLFVWNMYGKNAEENEKQIVHIRFTHTREVYP